MTTQTMTLDPAEPGMGISSPKLGMWLFLASEVMFFTGLIGAYIVLRAGAPEWPHPASILNVPLTALNTFILICSSVTMVKAYSAITRGDQAGLEKWLLATIVGGTIFLSIQAFEYHHLYKDGFHINGSLFGSCFYTLTGFHGAHVLGGVILLACTAVRAFRGHFSSSHYDMVELSGLYWHFVDLVWIILFTILYLI